MTSAAYMAILPHMTLTGVIVVLLLVVSFARNHALVAAITVIGLVATLVTIGLSLAELPQQVTPLILVDRYAAFFNTLFLFAAIVTVLISYRYLGGRRGDLEEYYVLVATSTLGAMTMASAVHFASFVLGLEILAISLYPLIAYPEEGHRPLEASLKYLVLSGVASTTMLFGMALLYSATGSLVFTEVADAIAADVSMSLYVIVGNAMLFTGIAFKLSLVPFHMWTPDVYEGAPAPVTGYVATVSKGAVFAVALRYAIEAQAFSDEALVAVVSIFAVLSMVIGNLLALLQENVKRILAYSSIAHLGYLLIALIAVDALADEGMALETGMIYLAAYFLMTLGAFGVVSLLSSSSEERDADALERYTGLFWEHPLLAAVMTTVMLSLAGIPLTMGFIAKFYLFAAGVEATLWVLLWALVIGSGIAIFYYLRIIFTMSKRPQASTEAGALSYVGVGTVVVLGALLIAFGIYPTPLIDVVQTAVAGFGI
ncbi:MAG: NADH-quinone oxidoreductase subunit N [Pseudomonadales bacterium]